MNERLLILSCTQRKVRHPRTLPAIKRYDGPSFRVVRRFTLEQPKRAPDIFVLSAKYGLIDADTPVNWYDDRLTRRRCDDLVGEVTARIVDLVKESRYSDIFLYSGKEYLKLLMPGFKAQRKEGAVHVASGGLGEKLTRLKVWLASDDPVGNKVEAVDHGTFTVRGCQYTLSVSQLMLAARKAVKEDVANAFRCHGWCVVIEGRRFAPKWLLAAATGLPVSKFHTDDARAVLTRLGLPLSQAFAL